jgi:hypothetical protein
MRSGSSPRIRIVGPGLDPLKLNSGVNRLPGDVARGGWALPTTCSASDWPGHSDGRQIHGSAQSSATICAMSGTASGAGGCGG